MGNFSRKKSFIFCEPICRALSMLEVIDRVGDLIHYVNYLQILLPVPLLPFDESPPVTGFRPVVASNIFSTRQLRSMAKVIRNFGWLGTKGGSKTNQRGLLLLLLQNKFLFLILLFDCCLIVVCRTRGRCD